MALRGPGWPAVQPAHPGRPRLLRSEDRPRRWSNQASYWSNKTPALSRCGGTGGAAAYRPDWPGGVQAPIRVPCVAAPADGPWEIGRREYGLGYRWW